MAKVYVFQEEGSNFFKIGRSKSEGRAAGPQPHAGDARPLVLFREIQTEDVSECEGMFHRLLGSRRVRVGSGTEFFEVEREVMAEEVERIGRIFSQLQAARSTVRPLSDAFAADVERRAEAKDLALRQRLIELKQERSALDLQIELLELKLKERIGETAGIAGVASWKTQHRRCFNEQIFRERKPAMYQDTLERYHRLDTSAWKQAEPENYRAIQTTCYRLSSGRVFRLLS